MASEPKHTEIFDSCPHCGHKLSPWQQVLLGVDRALTCKNCWYRIILDPKIKNEDEEKSKEDKSKFEE
jgi:DNA-directed RNA polymerase subunit RPC12/RpoP